MTAHVRQLMDPSSAAFTYLLWDPSTRTAAIIDPVHEHHERDLALIRELGLKLRFILETHAHVDHTSGARRLAERTEAEIVAHLRCPCPADRRVRHGDLITLGGLTIEVLETPGHTLDSVCYHVEDQLFSGDTLLVRTTGRTDLQAGDAGLLYDSITQVLFALPDDTRVWPGHDFRGCTATTIGEERRHNRRVAERARVEFVRQMADLMRPARYPPARAGGARWLSRD